MLAVGERRAHGDDGGEIDAIHGNRAPDRLEDGRRADQTAESQPRQSVRFRERPTDDHVGERRKL